MKIKNETSYVQHNNIGKGPLKNFLRKSQTKTVPQFTVSITT